MTRNATKTEPIVIERNSESVRIRIELEPHREHWPRPSGDELNQAFARGKVAEPLRRRLLEAHRAAWVELLAHAKAHADETPVSGPPRMVAQWEIDLDPEATYQTPNPRYQKPATR